MKLTDYFLLLLLFLTTSVLSTSVWAQQSSKRANLSLVDQQIGTKMAKGQAKVYTDSRGEKIRIATGDIAFADKVVDFKIGHPRPVGDYAGYGDPKHILGQPDHVDNGIYDPKPKCTTMGCGGVLTLEFTDNVLIDGDGNDLYIFEVGEAVEAIQVAISKNNKDWIEVGKVAGSTASLDISSFVKKTDVFRYVRLTDLRTGCPPNSENMVSSDTLPYPGADIDAVAVGNIQSEKEIEEEKKKAEEEKVLMPKTKKEQALPPLTPNTPLPTLDLSFRQREVKIVKQIEVRKPDVVVEIWDEQYEDGDSIYLTFNQKPILQNYVLRKNKKRLEFSLKDNSADNLLVLHAVNNGSRPPCTAALRVNNRFISLNSTLEKSSAIKFVLRKEAGKVVAKQLEK